MSVADDYAQLDENSKSAELAIGSIGSVEAARQLEPEWRMLANRASGVTPFQDPAWLLPCHLC